MGYCSIWLMDSRSVSASELAHHRSMLDVAASERCRRFRRIERQSQFVLGRALLKQVTFDAPMVEQPPLAPKVIGFNVSLSHSGPWIACAISKDVAIGLDIEQINHTRDICALANAAFSIGDQALLAKASEVNRTNLFYSIWCQLEARIKLGCGDGHNYFLTWPELSIVLCAAAELSSPPTLHLVKLNSGSIRL
jgi:4'-phosphopantetheinyl transferase